MTAYQTHTSETEVVVSLGGRGGTPDTRSALSQSGQVAGISELFERANVADDLRVVEQLLLDRSVARSELITTASAHTIRSGGKRLRAALALLAARLGSYSLEQVIHAASSIELLHAASLVHDDLVDQSARRRGHITVHTRWDNDVALMVGDYFFALAAAEMALSPDTRIIGIYANAVQMVVAGELSPVTVVTPTETAMRQYFYKTGHKTAALFEAACRAGMVSGGGSDAQIEALGRYGWDLGVAFQIVDDVLDIVGDEQTLGKPAGNDLRQGTITLPLIYAVARTNSPRLRMIVEASELSEAEVHATLDEIVAAGGVDAALDEARRLAKQAVSHLDGFPLSTARRALVDLAQFVVERDA